MYLPTTIEIETINRCNGECSFCPVNIKVDKRPYSLMSYPLFFKIIQELADINYSGEINLFSNNEPLLDKRIVEFAKIARKVLPNSRLVLFTNGTLLTDALLKELVPLLDRFVVDIYYGSKTPSLICLHPKVELHFINPNLVRTSRGGQAPNKSVSKTRVLPCTLPFRQMVVRPSGEVSLCCNDALGTVTLGDLNKQSIKEVWNSKAYWQVRWNMLTKWRWGNKLCRYCDTRG